MAQRRTPLTADDLKLESMYVGKDQKIIHTTVRDLQDYRIITWINSERTVLQYDGPSVPKERNNSPTMKVEEFLQWVSHEVIMEGE